MSDRPNVIVIITDQQKATASHPIDIVPTLLDLMGQAVPEHLEGRSLRPVLESGADAPAALTQVADERASWKVGMIHGSRRLPGKVDSDDVIFSDAEIAASGLDYLALGHWHSHWLSASFSSGSPSRRPIPTFSNRSPCWKVHT